MGLGAPELLIVLVIVLLLFGGAKLPKLAKSLGEAQREFKKGTEEGETGTVVSKDVTTTTVVAKDVTTPEGTDPVEKGPIS
ncbi:MAG: twin-arginine translocase TatA/TatE family subunit [Aquihabitans sp.]